MVVTRRCTSTIHRTVPSSTKGLWTLWSSLHFCEAICRTRFFSRLENLNVLEVASRGEVLWGSMVEWVGWRWLYRRCLYAYRCTPAPLVMHDTTRTSKLICDGREVKEVRLRRIGKMRRLNADNILEGIHHVRLPPGLREPMKRHRKVGKMELSALKEQTRREVLWTAQPSVHNATEVLYRGSWLTPIGGQLVMDTKNKPLCMCMHPRCRQNQSLQVWFYVRHKKNPHKSCPWEAGLSRAAQGGSEFLRGIVALRVDSSRAAGHVTLISLFLRYNTPKVYSIGTC